jgi:hypothetical protein
MPSSRPKPSAQPSPPPRRRWLVIDPSSEPHKIGWAFFHRGMLERCGTIERLPGTHPPLVRYDHILRKGQTLLRALHPDWLLIEDQFLGNNPKTLRILTAAKTLWIVLALQAEIPITEVTPAEWQRPFQQSWRIGRRRADLMPSIEAAIRATYPHLPPTIDLNTLCAIGIGMARLRSVRPTP